MKQWAGFDEIAEVVAEKRPRLTFILGGPDVGKSTLTRQIAGVCLHGGLAVGLVDGDVGQSSIGPPTTIGMAIIHDNLPDFYTAQALYFAGDTNPVRRMLEVCVGAKSMVDKAHGTGVVLFDSSGLIVPPYGVTLKYNKVALLRPDMVVAIEKSDELAPILSWLDGCRGTTIVRARPPEGAHPVTARQRTKLRQEQYRRYLRGAVQQSIPLEGLALYPPEFLSAKVNPAGLLVGLQGRDWETVAVGIIESLDREVVNVFTPYALVDQVCGIVAGDLRLSRAGVELGRVHPREFF